MESGASHMTLEAVAERSGVSKGGLIYHFPSKELLLQAMVERMTERYDQLRRKFAEEGCTNALAAEIKLLHGKTSEEIRLSAALLAVAANQPELTCKMRERLREHFSARSFATTISRARPSCCSPRWDCTSTTC
jgi:AcrR family transcriptional regulator